ncbi:MULTISPECIES: DoxX family protein [unclassified Streptomyces]|uniref:DoxX family protein n=1 Tax=unclassified Streptomyces TaxID=2593676 RepID=UPI003318E512
MANTQLTSRLNQYQPYALGLFRIVVGLLFACHGANTLFGVITDGETIAAGTWPKGPAAVIELVGGTLVLLGIGTRSAAFLCSGAMAYAYFSVHQPEGLFPLENNGGEPVLFCWAFLLLIFTGPGALAADKLFTAGGANRTEGEQRTTVSA